MPPARLSKKASFPAAAWRCCARPSALDEPEGSKATSRSASTSSAAPAKSRSARSLATPATKARSSSRRSARTTNANFGFNAATGSYEDLVTGRRHRSDQGDPHGSAERRFDQRPDADHRSDDLRDPGEEVRSGRSGGGHGPEMDY